MSADPQVITALRVAFRHLDAPTTTASEAADVLDAIVICIDGPEGEAASRLRHHREQARQQQLILSGLFATTSNPTA